MSDFQDNLNNIQGGIGGAADAANAAATKIFKPATDFANTLPDAFKNLMTGQQGDINNWLGRYSGQIGSQEGVPSIYNRTGLENNIPTLRQNANTLNTAYANIPYTYSAAATGHDVNANQLSQIIGRKTYEMAPAMTSANNALATGLANQQQQVGATQQQQAKELLPIQAEGPMLNDYLARQATGFSTANEQKLGALVSQAQSGMGLTSTQLTLANALAVAQKQYQAQVEAARIAATASENVAKIGNQYKILNPAQQLINTFSGSGYTA